MTSGCSIATWIYYDNTLGASDVFVMAYYGGVASGHYVYAGDYDQWFLAYDNLPCGDEIRLTGGDGLAWIECLDLEGVPELVVEVAASSVSYDLHQKKNVYRRSGVPEYLVVRTVDLAVDWFVLRDGVYETVAADAAGVRRSPTLPGLWLDAAASLRGDDAAMACAVAAGRRSPEHAAFVAARDAGRGA